MDPVWIASLFSGALGLCIIIGSYLSAPMTHVGDVYIEDFNTGHRYLFYTLFGLSALEGMYRISRFLKSRFDLQITSFYKQTLHLRNLRSRARKITKKIKGAAQASVRSHILTVVNDFLPKLYKQQKELAKNIAYVSERIERVERKIYNRDQSVKDLYKNSEKTLRELRSRLNQTESTIADCLAFLDLMEIEVNTSIGTDFDKIDVGFTQLAKSVTETRDLMKAAEAEVEETERKASDHVRRAPRKAIQG